MAKTDSSVTVVMPVHNRPEVLVRALDSVWSQSRLPCEVIVVDDGSDDPVQQLVAKQYDNRTRVIRNENKTNANVARNIGCANASGQFIAFLDSDDAWQATHLESKLALLKKQGADAVWGQFFVEPGHYLGVRRKFPSRPTKDDTSAWLFASGGDARTSSLVVRSKWFRNILWDDKLEKHQDVDLALRLAENGLVAFDPDPTVLVYVDRTDNISRSMNHAASMYLLEKHYQDIPPKPLSDLNYHLLSITYYFDRLDPLVRTYARNILALGLRSRPKPLFVGGLKLITHLSLYYASTLRKQLQ